MNTSKHEIYMNMVLEYSKFSKCQFTKVSCFFVNEYGRIIATGVNGTISGDENCCDHTFDKREDHVEYTRDNEIHAEQNAILELATCRPSFNTITVYTNLSPCHECLKLILGLTRNKKPNTIKIDKIIYNSKYHRTTDEEMLKMKEKAKKFNCTLMSLEEARNEF